MLDIGVRPKCPLTAEKAAQLLEVLRLAAAQCLSLQPVLVEVNLLSCSSETFVLGSLTLQEPTVRWRGSPLQLTAGEFRVVSALTKKTGEVILSPDLHSIARGPKISASTAHGQCREAVRTMMLRIRKKFKRVDNNFNMIGANNTHGYFWRQTT